MTVLLLVVLVVLLIAGNAFFVAAELAVIGAPHAAIEQRAAEGNAGAKRVFGVLSDPIRQDRYIATAQLGITAASLALGMLAEHQIALWLEVALSGVGLSAAVIHSVAIIVAVMLLTYLHVVFGEMIPKAIALESSVRASLFLEPPMRVMSWAFYPAVVALSFIGDAVVRAFGLSRARGPEHYSPEELQIIVRESEAGGLIRPEAAQVVGELLDLSRLTAWEVMVPRVKVRGLEIGAPLADTLAAVRRWPHTRYPVFARDLDHIVGLVHIKDIVRRGRKHQPIAQSDVRSIPFVPGTANLSEVFAIMRDGRRQLVVVMDEHGGTAGILTLTDLFDEVVGEIDEKPVRPAIQSGRGGIVVAGTMRLDELGELLSRDLEHEEVDTVSGLVLALTGRPPEVGDGVTYAGLAFTVTEVAGHGVGRARVSPIG
ncbi:MAG TPA: hemolysin family protein [Kofleriaceae bacterium]|nr:hemolysin family protein [Kofleriaceae bacterium]